MKYSDIQIRNCLALGEDQNWEFMELDFKGNYLTSPSLNEIADEIIAFANSGGGVILFCVTEHG